MRRLSRDSEHWPCSTRRTERIPYVSKVDAGTLELVRQWVPEIKTSANLIQYFECVWSDAQLAGHRESARIVTRLMHEAFDRARQLIHERGATDEMEIQDFLMRRLNEESMETDFPPIVAANGHAGTRTTPLNPTRHPPSDVVTSF